MPKLAANLSMLYTELPFLERFAAARADGFRAVEFMFPYEYAPARIAGALRDNDLRLVLHNMPPGDWAAGERGVAALPARRDEFRAGVSRALDYAQACGCKQVNCLSGLTPSAAGTDDARATLVENLRFAASRLAEAGIKLLVEPINRFDMPGFYLDTVEKAVAVLDEVGSDNLFLQYDVYHRQRSGGELIETFRRLRHRIAHVQIADTPGRNEPGSGEINYPAVFDALDRESYEGWVGCEYRPANGTSAGLGWARDYLGT